MLLSFDITNPSNNCSSFMLFVWCHCVCSSYPTKITSPAKQRATYIEQNQLFFVTGACVRMRIKGVIISPKSIRASALNPVVVANNTRCSNHDGSLPVRLSFSSTCMVSESHALAATALTMVALTAIPLESRAFDVRACGIPC